MNPKQTIPPNANAAPVALAVLGIIAVAKLLDWLFPSDETKKEPEIKSAESEAENRRKEAETTAFQQIPLEIPAKPPQETAQINAEAERRRKEAEIIAFWQIQAAISAKPAAAPPVQKITTPAPVPAAVASQKSATQAPLPQAKKKFVTWADMVVIFQHGERALTRPAAVSELKNRGFGKSAAYAALTPDGRFSAWLKFAPDGIITWTDR
ncbi:MAG TPA: hypothetical protein VMD27_06170 [Candidatus Aquilonibacter sp.]|nr:hypothetical protein [Candidatus Aquilonibacter sp.]